MKGPPVILRLKEVPSYITRTYGLTIQYQKVCRWVREGYGRETLETRQAKERPPFKRLVQVTTEEWVNQFLERTGQVPCLNCIYPVTP